MKSLEVPLPPLGEQRRIVSSIEQLFTQLDEGVRSLQQARTQLEQYKQAILQSFFNDIQERRQLGSILREPLKNGKSAKPIDGVEGVPIIKLSAVTEKNFADKNVKNCNLQYKEVTDLWIKNEDIFIERSNTPELVGSAAIYLGDDDRFIFPDLLIRIRLDKTQAIPKYVSYYLDSPEARIYFKKNAKGTSNSMPKLSQGPIESLSLPLPSLKEQEKRVVQLEDFGTLINYIQHELKIEFNKTSLLKQSILKSAFEGKLVSQNPSDEPASTLLERIKVAKSSGKMMASGQRRLG